MKHARIRYQGRVHQVTVEDANAVRLADGTLLAEDRVEWLPPATGSMFALGLNYADHAAELSFKAPSEPLAFIKSPGTYTGHRQVSWRPDNVDYMHYECELVAVIGKPARNVRREDALGYLAGYTVCNDYAIRDYLENYYRPNLRVKNRDATTPVGPWIVDAAEVPEPNRLTLRTWVNGELRQEGSTADMIFDIPYLIEYFSSFMTLQPGDMIATGTPEGLSDVVPGDEVVVEVEGVGRLVNRNRQRGRILPRPRTGARRMIKHWINGREVESKDVFENYKPGHRRADRRGCQRRRGGNRRGGGGGPGSLPEMGQYPGQGARAPDAPARRADRPERAAPGGTGDPRHRPADPPDEERADPARLAQLRVLRRSLHADERAQLSGRRPDAQLHPCTSRSASAAWSRRGTYRS